MEVCHYAPVWHRLDRNCKQHIVVKCKVNGCHFHICVRGHVKVEGMIVKDFSRQHRYSVGDQSKIGEGGKRKIRAK